MSQIFTADFHDGSAETQQQGTTFGVTPTNSDPSNGGGVDILSANGGTTSAGLESMMGFDFDTSGFDALSSSYPDGSNGSWTADPLLSDNLYIDWETLWPMDGMMM